MNSVRVNTLSQALQVMEIRNKVAGTFTTYNQPITEYQQELFFREEIQTRRAIIFLFYDESMCIGFGMVRWIDSTLWATLGVLPEQQSKGYGTEIYNHLFAFAQTMNHPLYLEIWGNNNASLIAALKAGFHVYGVNDSIVLLVRE